MILCVPSEIVPSTFVVCCCLDPLDGVVHFSVHHFIGKPSCVGNCEKSVVPGRVVPHVFLQQLGAKFQLSFIQSIIVLLQSKFVN